MLRAVQTVSTSASPSRSCWAAAVIEGRSRDMGLRMELNDDRRASSTRRRTASVRPAAVRVSAARRTPRRRRPRRERGARRPLRRGRADAARRARGCRDRRRHRRLVAAVDTFLPSFRAAPMRARVYALSCLVLPSGTLFVCDTHMMVDPTAEQIAEMTAAGRRGGARLRHRPKVALLSHSSFGASDTESPARCGGR